MTEHYDHQETRDPEARETALFSGLPNALRDIAAKSAGWADWLGGVDLSAIGSRAALAAIPVLRKPDLMERQSADPPFGGFITGGEFTGDDGLLYHRMMAWVKDRR